MYIVCRIAKVSIVEFAREAFLPTVGLIVEKPLTGFFGDAATPRDEMLHLGDPRRRQQAVGDGGRGLAHREGLPPAGAALYLKAKEGVRLRGAPVRPVSVVAELAHLADLPAFKASTPCYMRVVVTSNVEDWGSMLIGFDDETVAQISASDVVLGGVRNQIALYGAKAVVFTNINPNDAVQAYAREASVLGDEYIVEKIET